MMVLLAHLYALCVVILVSVALPYLASIMFIISVLLFTMYCWCCPSSCVASCFGLYVECAVFSAVILIPLYVERVCHSDMISSRIITFCCSSRWHLQSSFLRQDSPWLCFLLWHMQVRALYWSSGGVGRSDGGGETIVKWTQNRYLHICEHNYPHSWLSGLVLWERLNGCSSNWFRSLFITKKVCATPFFFFTLWVLPC